jgi:hypothetical protein
MPAAFPIDISAQTWAEVLAPGRLPDAKREAPRAQDLALCERAVVYPDSLAISGGAANYLDVWKTLGHSGVWDPLTEKPSPPDILRAKVVGTDCGFYSPFNLILRYGPYWFRLRAGAIPNSPGRENFVFLIGEKVFEAAMWTRQACDSCSFHVVSAERFADSSEKVEAIARKIAQDSSRARAKRASIEQARAAALANTADSLQAVVRAKMDAAEARERRRENVAAEKKRADAIRREGWPVAITDAVIARKIRLGMTREQVRAAWGKPDDIHRTVTAYAVREQWIYGSLYVYFDDGVVTAWQD